MPLTNDDHNEGHNHSRPPDNHLARQLRTLELEQHHTHTVKAFEEDDGKQDKSMNIEGAEVKSPHLSVLPEHCKDR